MITRARCSVKKAGYPFTKAERNITMTGYFIAMVILLVTMVILKIYFSIFEDI
jgi:hypothetical protein